MAPLRSRSTGAARLAIGVVGLAASAVPVRRDSIGRREHRAFRLVNDLPDWLHRPAWVVMQLGALGAAPAAASRVPHPYRLTLGVRVRIVIGLPPYGARHPFPRAPQRC